MKFAVVAAFVAVAYAQDDAAAEEAAPVSACAEECVGEGECCAVDAEGTGSCAVVEEGGDLTCESLEAAGEGEAEGSTTLFASVATVAVAASMMF